MARLVATLKAHHLTGLKGRQNEFGCDHPLNNRKILEKCWSICVTGHLPVDAQDVGQASR
jgi:hypothetical protein